MTDRKIRLFEEEILLWKKRLLAQFNFDLPVPECREARLVCDYRLTDEDHECPCEMKVRLEAELNSELN